LLAALDPVILFVQKAAGYFFTHFPDGSLTY
jgi:hypothetical protein